MAVKKLTYVIEVDTQNGKVKIDGLTQGFVNAELAAKKLNSTFQTTSRSAGQMADKTGLAGAAIVEIGRTISDSNYGMMAMANNLQQVATLMITLIATSGGLTNAVHLLTKAFMGPLGLIVVAQWFIADLEKQDRLQKQTAASADDLANSLNKLAQEYLKLEKNSSKYAEVSGELNALERELAEMRFEQPNSFRAIAAKREEIITKEIELLLKEREAVYGTDVQLYDDYTKKIDDLRAKRELVLREEFGKRKKEDAVDVGSPFGITKITVDTEALLQEQALKNQSDFVSDMAILDAQRTANENQQSRARRELMGLEARQRLEALALIGDGIESFGEVVGKQTQVGKLIASAGALISTYAAVTKALDTPGLGLARIPYAISVGLFGLSRVAAINRVKVPNSGGGGGGGGQAANLTTTQAPTFNIVGSSNASQLRDAVEGQLNRPVKAYVTTKDIRSNEELDRNTRRGATIG